MAEAGGVRSSSDSRVRKIDARAASTHTSNEVTVSRSNSDFAITKNTHITAQTSATSRIGYNGTCIDKDIQVTRFFSLLKDLLCCRSDDKTGTARNTFTF